MRGREREREEREGREGREKASANRDKNVIDNFVEDELPKNGKK